jgi:hypothetical protein
VRLHLRGVQPTRRLRRRGVPAGRTTRYAACVPTTKLLLTTGERVEVSGSSDDVTKLLEDASRSTSGTLAWLREAETGQAVGVNPAHVVMLRSADA